MPSQIYKNRRKKIGKISKVGEASNFQIKLEQELERLKRKMKYGYELKVIWLPNHNSKLSGEVKNDIVYIYELKEDEAIKTLRHEFIDYMISQAIEPYKDIVNKFIQLLNEETYKKKESVVEALLKLFDAGGEE
jgi:hypothetical protein